MKKLSVRYSIQQILYWSVNCGIFSFAATFFLGKGFKASQVGTVLFLANLLSCLFQPMLAGRADKAKGHVLPKYIAVLTCASMLSFGSLAVFDPPLLLFGLLYLTGVLTFDMMMPLLNSLSVYYNARSFYINYGLGRGLGALAFSFASLGIGYLMQYCNNVWLLILVVTLLGAFLIVSVTYPKTDEEAAEDAFGKHTSGHADVPDESSVSVLKFFTRYKRFSFSLIGIFSLATFHIMIENYMIEIIKRLGGDSSNLGTALFIACITACPVMIFFDKIHEKLKTYPILIIAGFAYILKGVLFIIAKSVTAIYLIELLQCVTYNFLSPVQMYYARESVREQDMVKGQSMITASYTLGCAAGSMLGGQIISHFGVPVMMYVALGMAEIGTVNLLFAKKRQKRKRRLLPSDHN